MKFLAYTSKTPLFACAKGNANVGCRLLRTTGSYASAALNCRQYHGGMSNSVGNGERGICAGSSPSSLAQRITSSPHALHSLSLSNSRSTSSNQLTTTRSYSTDNSNMSYTEKVGSLKYSETSRLTVLIEFLRLRVPRIQDLDTDWIPRCSPSRYAHHPAKGRSVSGTSHGRRRP